MEFPKINLMAKQRKTTHPESLKSCCKKFERRARACIDLVSSHDESLRFVSSLLWKMDYTEIIEIKDAHSLAFAIEDYLNRKQLIDHVFLNRTLPEQVLESIGFREETKRIRNILRV